MPLPTIIYYGALGLQSEVLHTYFTNLGVGFRVAETPNELVQLTRSLPYPLVVIADSRAPSDLVRTARQLVPDPSSAFPHVFILADAEPFDAQLEAITVITGPSRLRRLSEHLRVFIHEIYRAENRPVL